MYDLSYYYKMLRNYSPTAFEISRRRWELLSSLKPKTVLDYGCGCSFFKAFAPEGVEVDTFDIMPVPQTGITKGAYDVLCLWDVIEHFDWGNFERNYEIPLEKIFDVVGAVALTVPILPGLSSFSDWKHRKPKEHLTVFTVDSLRWFMDVRGFRAITWDERECPPREDITSFLFERKPLPILITPESITDVNFSPTVCFHHPAA